MDLLDHADRLLRGVPPTPRQVFPGCGREPQPFSSGSRWRRSSPPSGSAPHQGSKAAPFGHSCCA